jgi:predicted secreted protein
VKRTLLIAALFCCVAAAEFSARAQSPSTSTSPAPAFRVDAKAVWIPSASVLSDIRKVCSAGDPAQHEACFVDSMKSAGASAEAVEFVKAFASNGLAYVRAFRDTGRVSIAYIEYLFRANEMDGVLLVNGTPPMIDVDDYKYLSQGDLRKNGDYGALLQKYSNISVFPDDRYHTDLPVEKNSTGDNQEFDVEYLLQDGCHACTRIGTLVASFIFDASGRLSEIRVLKVRPGGDADYDRPMLSRRPDPKYASLSANEAKLDPTEIHTIAGQSFTIALPANHSTGYSWRLARPLDVAILRQASETYREDSLGRIGGGGREFWTFEALAAGATEIYFEYARPFEKDAAPVNSARYRIEIK